MRRKSVQFKPSIEHLNIVLVDEAVLEQALEWVKGCETCRDKAVVTFDYLLDFITGVTLAPLNTFCAGLGDAGPACLR